MLWRRISAKVGRNEPAPSCDSISVKLSSISHCDRSFAHCRFAFLPMALKNFFFLRNTILIVEFDAGVNKDAFWHISKSVVDKKPGDRKG